jgi:alkylhydroperoxidase family enzyme
MGGVTSFTLDERLVPAGPIAGVFAELSAQFWHQPHLSAELVELCRLTLAVMHGAPDEQKLRHPSSQNPAEPKIAAVLAQAWRKNPAFSPAEQAALDFTEYYFMDPGSIPDEVAGAVLAHFGESGLVCLVEVLGFVDSRIRLALIYSSLSA